jgi:hypothetical protein
MEITDLASIEEKVAYINGFLSAIQTLNTTSNNIMDHSFTLVKLIDNNLEKSLQKELNALNTSFSFNIINDWGQTFEIDNTYFFSNVISAIKGDVNIDAASLSKLLDQFNLKDQLSDFINCINGILSLFEYTEVFEVMINWHESRDRDRLFAHAESNYVFKITELHFLFLRLTAYD